MSLLNFQVVRPQCQDRTAREQSLHVQSETAYEANVDMLSRRVHHSSCRRYINPIKDSVWHPLLKKETQAEFALLKCCQRGRDGGDGSTAVKQFCALRTQPRSCLGLQGFNRTPPTSSAYQLSWQEAVSAASAEAKAFSVTLLKLQGSRESSILQTTSWLKSKWCGSSTSSCHVINAYEQSVKKFVT